MPEVEPPVPDGRDVGGPFQDDNEFALESEKSTKEKMHLTSWKLRGIQDGFR